MPSSFMGIYKPFTLIKLLLVLASIAILSVPLWLKVDQLPIRLWDESRNAVNAIEMYQTNNWLIRTYNFQPETYELKPPLLTWFQVLSLRIFGLNELAIRLPSVIFSLLTLALVTYFVYAMTKSWFASILAAGITATSAAFYGEHAGRFGDHEALLTFLIVSLLYHVYKYSITQKIKHIYFIAILTCLGVLCKSVAILMTGPGLFLYLLVAKKILPLLKNKHTYIAAAVATVPIVSYYYLREQVQPGYLDLVWSNELFPRFLNTASHTTFKEVGPWYYTTLLVTSKMKYWIWALLLVLIPPLFLKRVKTPWLFWTLNSAVFLFIISKGSQNFWYVAPAIPMLAGAIATSAHFIIALNSKYKTAVILPLIILFVISYQAAYSYAFSPAERYYEWETNGISHYLKDTSNFKHLNSNIKILLDENHGYEPHKFYVQKLKLEKGIDLKRTELYHLNLHDTLLISHLSTLRQLQSKYQVHVIDSSYQHTKLLTITNHE